MAETKEGYWSKHHTGIIQCVIAAYCAVFATWGYFHPRTAPMSNQAASPQAAVPMTSSYSMPLGLFIGIIALVLSVVVPAIIKFIRGRGKSRAGTTQAPPSNLIPAPAPSPKPPNRLKIIEAHYGIEGINNPDVTQYLLERLHGNSYAELVGADLFKGFDPVGGNPNKKLTVRYSFDGKEMGIVRPEHEWLILPEDMFLGKLLNVCHTDLSRSQAAHQQCVGDLRDSASRNLEYRAKLAVFSALQWDALQLSSDLLQFLKQIGPPPAPKYTRDQIAQMSSTETKRLVEANDGDYSEACAYHDGDHRIFDLSADGLYQGMVNRHTRMRPWYEKLRAAYVLGWESKVEEIRNRLALESLSDGALLLTVQDFNAVKNIQLIAAKLWELALKLEEKKWQ